MLLHYLLIFTQPKGLVCIRLQQQMQDRHSLSLTPWSCYVTASATALICDSLQRLSTTKVYQLSLAIPPWIGTMSNGEGYSQCWGRNGEFCVTV